MEDNIAIHQKRMREMLAKFRELKEKYKIEEEI
jgi:hypothetical protein